MMDPAEAEKFIALSANVNLLNTQVAGLTDAVGALVRHLEQAGMVGQPHQPLTLTPLQQVTAIAEALGSLARHWERAQLNMTPPQGGPMAGGGL